MFSLEILRVIGYVIKRLVSVHTVKSRGAAAGRGTPVTSSRETSPLTWLLAGLSPEVVGPGDLGDSRLLGKLRGSAGSSWGLGRGVGSPWGLLWDAGKNIFGIVHNSALGWLGEGPRLGKGGIGVVLGEGTTMGRFALIEGQRDKVGWLCASRWLDSVLLWPCPALISVVWPVFSLKSPSNCWVRGCVRGGGSWCQQPESDHG